MFERDGHAGDGTHPQSPAKPLLAVATQPDPAAAAAQPDKPGWLEWGGVLMLGLGSYLIPIIGTMAGLVMISLSRWWTTPQKVLASALSLLGVLIVPLSVGAIFIARVDHGSGSPQPAVSVELAPTRAPSS